MTYEVVEQTDWYEVGIKGSEIIAACKCGSGAAWPNKGLGRAVAAAWKTQHQHTDTRLRESIARLEGPTAPAGRGGGEGS